MCCVTLTNAFEKEEPNARGPCFAWETQEKAWPWGCFPVWPLIGHRHMREGDLGEAFLQGKKYLVLARRKDL